MVPLCVPLGSHKEVACREQAEHEDIESLPGSGWGWGQTNVSRKTQIADNLQNQMDSVVVTCQGDLSNQDELWAGKKEGQGLRRWKKIEMSPLKVRS